MTVLVTTSLSVAAGGVELIRGLDLALNSGELLAVLGRNGSGKSLLLHSLAGLRATAAGQIELAGRPLATSSRRDIARQLAFLPQDADPPQHVTVIDWVLGARFAHGSEWGWPSAQDRQVAQQCLERVQLGGFGERWLHTLSGGEQRRVALAALLAQQSVVLLLDEPTNHLDPQQIAATMQLVRSACDAGAAAIVTLHDPQLALRWADRALLLQGDGRTQCGRADQILTAAAVSELYGTAFRSVELENRRLLIAD